jgi:superoxide dismutase
MELHHDKHHQTYVNSYNAAIEQLEEAQSKGDVAAQINLKPLINFHGGMLRWIDIQRERDWLTIIGGHLNHSLFWENLAPKSQGGGDPPTGALSKAIDEQFGGLDGFKEKFNGALAGIQGSGWAWLVKDNQTGNIQIKAYAVSSLAQWSPLTRTNAWAESRSSCGSIHTNSRYWRMGACILSSIPEPKGWILQGHLGRCKLEGSWEPFQVDWKYQELERVLLVGWKTNI